VTFYIMTNNAKISNVIKKNSKIVLKTHPIRYSWRVSSPQH